MDLAKDSRIRNLSVLEIGDGKGEVGITLHAVSTGSEKFEDSVTRKTTVVPKGFPYDLYASDSLKYANKRNIKYI